MEGTGKAVLVALVLVAVMSLALCGTAFASATNNLTLDATISVTGLESGDKVDFYKVLAWQDSVGWIAAPGFDGATGLTATQVTTIAGTPASAGTPAVVGVISWDTAKAIAEMASTNNVSPKYSNVAAAADGTTYTATQNSPEAGLYMAIIKSTKSGVVYNPAFVAADFGVSGSESVDVGVTSYPSSSVAKKSTITLDKTMTGQTNNNDENIQTTNVGDTVTFKIETKIPIFTADYTNPVFKVKDTLSAGLDLTETSITLVKPTGAVKDIAYTIDATTTNNQFIISFDDDYLKSLGTITDVEITYSAVVTNAAVNNINVDDNTVDLIYSTNPSDETGAGRLRDKTKEYTFSIDARLLGSDSYDVTELVKVGLDQNGNEITETRPLDNGNSVGALQGATFKLYKDQACTQQYTNTYITDTLTSDADGRINIKGLDGGVYWIKEESAPAGYIKDQTAHKIEIKTSFSDHT